MHSATTHLPPPAGQPLVARLREATAAIHAAVEILPMMQRLTSADVSLADYRRYLTALAGLYALVEPPLYAAADAQVISRLAVRPKQPALRQALERLGVEPAAALARTAAALGALPLWQPTGSSDAVGGLYVLEGATLGGRVIAKHLRRLADPTTDVYRGALVFLDFHGEQTGAHWRDFGLSLDQLVKEGGLQPAMTEAGAVAMFEWFYGGLATLARLP